MKLLCFISFAFFHLFPPSSPTSNLVEKGKTLWDNVVANITLLDNETSDLFTPKVENETDQLYELKNYDVVDHDEYEDKAVNNNKEEVEEKRINERIQHWLCCCKKKTIVCFIKNDIDNCTSITTTTTTTATTTTNNNSVMIITFTFTTADATDVPYLSLDMMGDIYPISLCFIALFAILCCVLILYLISIILDTTPNPLSHMISITTTHPTSSTAQ